MSRTSIDAPTDGLEHEEVRVVRGRRSGATVTVAVHSTAAGPAAGGCRIARYETWRDGLDDALRLSAAMTTKNTLAGLPHGGGKTVVTVPEPVTAARRPGLLADIADVLISLGGRYVTGPDIGSSPEDMAVLHAATGGYAYCRPEAEGGSGNSNTATARGVLAALRVAVPRTFVGRSVAGLRVGVIGYGAVGELIARTLAADGAHVAVHDIRDTARVAVAAAGLTWWSTPSLADEFDIIIPAATGGLLTEAVAATCQARLIVGPANNQLAGDTVDDLLHRRGITWIPDMLASAGGVTYAVTRERLGLTEHDADLRVEAIGDTTTELLDAVAHDGTTPLRAAHRIATRRLEQIA